VGRGRGPAQRRTRAAREVRRRRRPPPPVLLRAAGPDAPAPGLTVAGLGGEPPTGAAGRPACERRGGGGPPAGRRRRRRTGVALSYTRALVRRVVTLSRWASEPTYRR